ncbi:MAG TPA: FHA domain-containing protein [Gemmataceae bacterium]|nr:FHA domain-containing protein [Gemmataceae bacterium]
MSFRLFIYYCALCGGWAAFLGWFAGEFLKPSAPLGRAGIKGMWLGMMIALGLGLVDTLWSVAITRLPLITMRVGVGVLVGCLAGLLGGIVGQALYGLTGWEVFYVFGWTLTGLLVGSSVGVFELLASVVLQKDFSGSLKKLIKALIGGALGGLIGGVLSLVLKVAFDSLFQGKDVNELWGPTAWGFVALGMCIGLLIGLAQVILKEAWVKIEKGRRAGREMILTRERTTIGRAESCDIGLFGDNQIEKLHASILLAGNRYFVEDQQTPTGTYVNEQRAVGRVPLKSGDRIRVGGSVLCFRERAKR